MRIVEENEWIQLMDKAIKEQNLVHIAFLWERYQEIKEGGYFELPF